MRSRQRFWGIPGSSLVITVILSLVIGLLCAAFVLGSYLLLLQRTVSNVEDALSRDMESSIDLVLEDDLPAGASERKAIDLFGTGNDSAYIREEIWGVYGVATVKIALSGHTKDRSFFTGALLPDTLDGCLFLSEHQRPLTLVGHTLLTGKAYLPKAGVKPGYIDQRGYAYTTLVNGDMERSGSALPVVDEELLRKYVALQARDTTRKTGDPVPVELMQSFSDTVRLLKEHGMLEMSGVRLSGHVLVASDSLIVVDADTRLDNIVLTAPVIRFKAGFAGRVQAFGCDSVVAESGCRFVYPSILAVVKKAGSVYQTRLVLADSCVLEGMVLAFCDSTDQDMEYTEVGNGARIRGVLYTNGYLVLHGSVEGATLADNFLYKDQSVILENFLVDVQLNRAALPVSFAAPVLFKGRKRNRVVQWVN